MLVNFLIAFCQASADICQWDEVLIKCCFQNNQYTLFFEAFFISILITMNSCLILGPLGV